VSEWGTAPAFDDEGGVSEWKSPVSGQLVKLLQHTGFDDCHFPNHLNVLVAAEGLLTAGDLGAGVGAEIRLEPAPRGPSPE
jgi:hypothetical protein